MDIDKDIVLVTQGKGKTIEKVAIYTFDRPQNVHETSKAASYCAMLNGLKLESGDEDKNWIFAQPVVEGICYEGNMLYPRKPFDGFITIDDRSMQRVLREIDADDLALALKGASDAVKNKFFQNMSKKAAAMLQEDMEFMGAVKETSIIEARNKLLDIVIKLQGMGLIDGFGITEKYID